MKQFRIDHGMLADKFAPFMFCLSMLFLIVLAALIVVWVDMPRFDRVNQGIDAIRSAGATAEVADLSASDSVVPEYTFALSFRTEQVGNYLLLCLLGIWIVVVVEVLIQLYLSVRSIDIRHERRWRTFAYLQCFCPPLRLAAPNIARQGQIWLPWVGWQTPSRKLYKKLVAVFSKPMLFFALLILPLLLIEFGLHSFVESNTWLRMIIHVCTGVIWCAFAVEFIVLVSASERRMAYVKKNWIDLAIILLPLILFLRSLRALRMLRLAKFAKVQQIARLSRIYRVRAVAMKALRAIMLFEVVSRAFGVSPERKLKRLNSELKEKQEELEEIEQEIAKVRILIKERRRKEQQLEASKRSGHEGQT